MNWETSAARKGDDDVCDRRDPKGDVGKRRLRPWYLGTGWMGVRGSGPGDAEELHGGGQAGRKGGCGQRVGHLSGWSWRRGESSGRLGGWGRKQ